MLPQESYIANHLQQLASKVRIDNLSTGNRCTAELKNLNPVIKYNYPSKTKREASLIAFSDESKIKLTYGQTGYIGGVYFEDDTNKFHILDWYSSEQTGVSFSSIGAEMIATCTSADRAYHMRLGISSLFCFSNLLSLVLTVDSHGLHATITSLHEGLSPSSYCITYSWLVWKQGNNMHAIGSGHVNVADALTKRNISIFQTLNKVASSRIIPDFILTPAERHLKNRATS